MVRLSARSRERQLGEPLQKAEVTLTLAGHGTIRAECEEKSAYTAIDRAADTVARQLRKVKEREARGGVHTHHKVPGSVKDILPEEPVPLDLERDATLADLPTEILRRKVFHVEAMTVDEAVARLENLDHAFLMFRDAAKPGGDIQVLYRRNAGGYGVLIPKA